MSFSRYAARRLLTAVPALLVVVVITFGLVHLAPGDPIYLLAGDGGTPEYYALMRQKLGLDRPWLEQLARYLAQVTRGDFGRSLQQGRPVTELMGGRLPATLLLSGTAFLAAVLLGVGLGILAGTRPGGVVDRLVLGITAVGSVIPVFWTGLLLVLIFSLWLGWFPVQGMTSARTVAAHSSGAEDVLRHLALPVFTLALQPLASFSRVMRVKLLEALSEPYVITARAKGLSGTRVLLHAVKNALLPVVTVIGGYAPILVSGTVLTEVVFGWPGLGRLALDATLSRDYPLILGLVILGSAGTVMINLLTDLTYAVLDPRVAYA